MVVVVLVALLATYGTLKVLMVLVIVSVDLNQPLQTWKLLQVNRIVTVVDYLLLTHSSVVASGGT